MKEALEEERRLRQEAKAAASPDFVMPAHGVLLSSGIEAAIKADEAKAEADAAMRAKRAVLARRAGGGGGGGFLGALRRRGAWCCLRLMLS